mgnify:CR=1 FL=1
MGRVTRARCRRIPADWPKSEGGLTPRRGEGCEAPYRLKTVTLGSSDLFRPSNESATEAPNKEEVRCTIRAD